MKMQVVVKAHKDGVVRNIKAKESGIVAKGDIIADIE
jgi:biotin carboxyl carrier protein